MRTEFFEEQKFTQWWLWLLLATIAIIPFYGIFERIFIGGEFGSNAFSNNGMIIAFVIVMIVIGLLLLIKLKTEIDQKEIRVSFSPFTKKTVKWSDVKSARVLNYGFVGGWGIRLFTRYGTVYNVRGNKGLAIELLNGEKFLVGTQKEAELTKIIEKLRAEGKF